MTDTPSVKLFDLNRMAKFVDQRKQSTFYIVPGEVVALTSLEDDETWIDYGVDRGACVRGSVQDIEDEINRALGATYAAHLQAARESGEKLKGILKHSIEQEDEEVFNLNDFVPKGVN